MAFPNSQINPAGAIPVYLTSAPGTSFVPVTGQKTVALTAAELSSAALTTQVTFTAPSGNLLKIAIGTAGVTLTTGYPLSPGQTVTLPINNLNEIYVIGGNTVDLLTWIGF